MVGRATIVAGREAEITEDFKSLETNVTGIKKKTSKECIQSAFLISQKGINPHIPTKEIIEVLEKIKKVDITI